MSIKTMSTKSCSSHLPDEPNSAADTLVIFQDLCRSDFEQWKYACEKCFQLLLEVSVYDRVNMTLAHALGHRPRKI